MASFSRGACFFLWIFMSFVICTNAVTSQASTVIVDSPVGKIQGLQKTDDATGQSYISFKGIPYAKPPLGELRFAKPQPHSKFDGVFDGTLDKKIVCPHLEIFAYGEIDFTESCLILNIQTRDIGRNSQPLRKVIVFIHGGAFIAGSSSYYESTSFVISQDVIVVTINYRLGILGFLSTENGASPGNYGLWDQTLALRWVKDNIRAFGGDPDDITIAGESAGGASVGYQMITPHTKGLFTKAFPQSGTATSGFAQSIDTLSLTLQVAKSMGCWAKDVHANITLAESYTVIKCLRQLPSSKLMSFRQISRSQSMFVPVVDGDFISDSPQNLLRDDSYLDSIGFYNRSYLVATNNDDAGLSYVASENDKAKIFSDNKLSADEKESIWKGLLSKTRRLYIESRLGEKGLKNKTIFESIEKFYARRYKDDSTCLAELTTDLNFLIPSLDYLSAASRRPSCNAYQLYFDYFPGYMVGSRRRGTYHGVDLLYWFDISPAGLENTMRLGISGNMSQSDLRLKKTFSSIIGNFIKTGDPGMYLEKCWPKFDPENSYYLNFNSQPWVSNFLKKDRMEFWLETVPKLLSEQHSHDEL